MKILCTMPGLLGDILTSLLAVRGVAEHFGQPVDLWISHNFKALAPLIEAQEYIDQVLTLEWNLADTGPVYTYERVHQSLGKVHAPLTVPEGYDRVAHLQYRGWPNPTCYEDCARNAEADLELAPGTIKTEPQRAWIVAPLKAEGDWAIVGNWRARDDDKPRFFEILREVGGVYVGAPNEKIEAKDLRFVKSDWMLTAAIFASAQVWVGNQSAPWVLANGLHMPKILTMEPDTRRHDVTFWLPTPGNRRIGMNAQEIQVNR